MAKGSRVVVLRQRTSRFGGPEVDLVWVPAEDAVNGDFFPHLVVAGRIGWVPHNLLSTVSCIRLSYDQPRSVVAMQADSIIFSVWGTYLRPIILGELEPFSMGTEVGELESLSMCSQRLPLHSFVGRKN